MGWIAALAIVLLVGWGILAVTAKVLRGIYRAFVPDPEEVPRFLKSDQAFLNLVPSYRYAGYYDPGKARLNKGSSPRWLSTFGLNTLRDPEPSPRIELVELGFVRANPANLRSLLGQRLKDIEVNAKYPGRAPAIEGGPTPPKEPSFVNLDEVFALEATARFTAQQRSQVEAYVAERNAVLQDEYDVFLGRYLSSGHTIGRRRRGRSNAPIAQRWWRNQIVSE